MEKLNEIATAWLGDDEIRAIVRQFALSTQVIRLYECGFEECINDFSAAELLIMAGMAMNHQRFVLMDAALAKADTRLLTMLADAGLLERESA